MTTNIPVPLYEELIKGKAPIVRLDEAHEAFSIAIDHYFRETFGAAFVADKTDEYRAILADKKNNMEIRNFFNWFESQVDGDKLLEAFTRAAVVTSNIVAPNFLVACVAGGAGHEIVPTAVPLRKAEEDAYVFFHFIYGRPGISQFMAELEYAHFPPSNRALNDQFLVYMTALPPRSQNALQMGIIGVPKDKMHLAEQAAAKSGLRFADAEKSAQTVLAEDGPTTMHFFGKNIYAVSNTPGHPVYTAGASGWFDLANKDAEEAKRVAAAHGFDIG